MFTSLSENEFIVVGMATALQTSNTVNDSTDAITRDAVVRLQRRVTFGVAEDQQNQLATTSELLDQMAYPDSSGLAAVADPWDSDLGRDRFETLEIADMRELGGAAVAAWVDTMTSSPRGFEEWMAWFWHGHFVVSSEKVRDPFLMMDYGRMLRRHALGNFGDLVREMTINGAMLFYLDGLTSTAGAPNENYARELLELFCLGIGSYTEDDVAAAASALTGWVVSPRRGFYDGRLVERRHDATRQSFLGADVSGADAVVDAVLAHPACAEFVAKTLADAIIGPGVSAEAVTAAADKFRESGYDIAVLARQLLQHYIDSSDSAGSALSGSAIPQPTPLAPIPWAVGIMKAADSQLPRRTARTHLRAAGQIPWAPPNVAGWPGSSYWLSSSSFIGRFNLGTVLAEETRDPTVVGAADDLDLGSLSAALRLPCGFGAATSIALTDIGRGHGVDVLSIAYSSPEMLVA